jgi:hypothetical protein
MFSMNLLLNQISISWVIEKSTVALGSRLRLRIELRSTLRPTTRRALATAVTNNDALERTVKGSKRMLQRENAVSHGSIRVHGYNSFRVCQLGLR